MLLKWFEVHKMKANPNKCHYFVNIANQNCQIKVGNETGTKRKCEKLLGVKIDDNLSFNDNVTSLFLKAG